MVLEVEDGTGAGRRPRAEPERMPLAADVPGHRVAWETGQRAVAARRGLSRLTVNVQLRAIYRKLQMTSRTAAARVAHALQRV